MQKNIESIMRIISLFNNKGGVGKTTLAFHLSCALAEMGKRVLIMDMDPQCNLTLYCLTQERLQSIWEKEDDFIDDFQNAYSSLNGIKKEELFNETRSVHFLLKPTEDGVSNVDNLPPLINVRSNLMLLPGRITLNQYESKISERWSSVYMSDPLGIRTVTNIRQIAQKYAQRNQIDYVIMDTSPSLGILNKVVISTVDGFVIPAFPDMFSLYGIRNIGNSLRHWKKEFDTIYRLISEEKRSLFPEHFVRFLGYTIYNAKKYSGHPPYDLAIAHQNYVDRIPETITNFISNEVRSHLTPEMVQMPIGGDAVMHTHNTFPSMAQKYKAPMWAVPSSSNLEPQDRQTITGNRSGYEATRHAYMQFAENLLERIDTLD